jgi:hypothetical protein
VWGSRVSRLAVVLRTAISAVIPGAVETDIHDPSVAACLRPVMTNPHLPYIAWTDPMDRILPRPNLSVSHSLIYAPALLCVIAAHVFFSYRLFENFGYLCTHTGLLGVV